MVVSIKTGFYAEMEIDMKDKVTVIGIAGGTGSGKTTVVKKLVEVANRITTEREKAIAYHDNIAPMLEQIRYHIDKLELIVDDQMWTLPKYRELLFVR